MNAHLQSELKKHVSALSWLADQVLTAPETNPAPADVFAIVDQPLTRTQVIESLRFHAEQIVKITQ